MSHAPDILQDFHSAVRSKMLKQSLMLLNDGDILVQNISEMEIECSIGSHSILGCSSICKLSVSCGCGLRLRGLYACL